MYTLIAENKYGQQLELTDNEAYVITSIEGLDPPDATINTTRNANADGSVFNSSYINDRQIIITLAINYPAEENRINLYTYFKTKMPITLFYENETRDVSISGYVQNFSVDFFAKKQVAQITIQCPKPLFSDVTENSQTLSQVASLFEFPFSIPTGKNLLCNTMATQTIGGVTFNVNTDGTITASGTASDYTWGAYVNQSFTLPSGSYILSGCPLGGSSTTYRLQLFAGDPSSPSLTVNDYGSGASFTLNAATTVSVRMLIKGSINNLKFAPMVRLSTDEDATYQSYYADNNGIEFSAIEENNITVINGGDVETGAIINIHALGVVSNPIIYNVETSEYFGLIVDMAEGDDIIINTKQKEKEVILISNGVQTNLIGSVKSGSTWLQLIPGTSEFTMTAEGQPENIYATFTITNLYEGV